MLLKVEEAAQRLQISRSLAYELCHRPDFPAIWINAHCVRVSERGLERWIEQEWQKKQKGATHHG